MSDKTDKQQQIQDIYNKTKNLKSPSELDHFILGKIRSGNEQIEESISNKSWLYLPVAASVILAVFLQLKPTDSPESLPRQPVKIVQLPNKKNAISIPEKNNRNQLPDIFFLPQEDINSKIVPACNGQLIEPESLVEKLPSSKLVKPKNKKSELPIKLIYPNNTTNNSPSCDKISNQVFKK